MSEKKETSQEEREDGAARGDTGFENHFVLALQALRSQNTVLRQHQQQEQQQQQQHQHLLMQVLTRETGLSSASPSAIDNRLPHLVGAPLLSNITAATAHATRGRPGISFLTGNASYSQPDGGLVASMPANQYLRQDARSLAFHRQEQQQQQHTVQTCADQRNAPTYPFAQRLQMPRLQIPPFQYLPHQQRHQAACIEAAQRDELTRPLPPTFAAGAAQFSTADISLVLDARVSRLIGAPLSFTRPTAAAHSLAFPSQTLDSMLPRLRGASLPSTAAAATRATSELPERETLTGYSPSNHSLQMPPFQDPAHQQQHHQAACIETAQGNEVTRPFLELREAIKLIPEEEKADYLEALEVAHHLLTSESDPMKFLRYHNFDVKAAAEDLVRYWKRRRESFGDRAFLPMNISGNGALSTHEIEFFETGVFVFLPNDARGRTVVCYDSSRRLETSVQIRHRVAFYISQIVSENPVSQTDGYVALFVISDPKYDLTSPQCDFVLQNIFPIKTRSWHIFNCIPNWNKTFLLRGFENSMTHMFGPLIRRHQTFVHSSKEKDEIVKTMKSFDLTSPGLPDCIGGSWSYELFSDWLTERHRVERERYLANSFSDPPAALSSTAARIEDASAHAPTTTTLTPTSCYLTNMDPNDISKELRGQLEKAMYQVPQYEKAAYTKALNEAPKDVWKEEFNPGRFLRAEFLNAWLAAKRIARYWKLRSDTFGPKGLLPLNQTGEGALERRDRTVLGTSFVNILPNDAEGRSVIWIDGQSLECDSANESTNRCLFYMFSLLAENDLSQRDGAILLYRMGSSLIDPNVAEFLECLASSLPLRFKAVHLLFHNVEMHSETKINLGNKTYIHEGDSPGILANKLKAFGISQDCLPKCLNGGWGYEKFVYWQELRIRVEWRVPIFQAGKVTGDAINYPAIHDGVAGAHTVDSINYPAIREYSLLPDEDKTERDRRLNVIHSRRKRDKDRIEQFCLQEECDELRVEHERLLMENRRLEDLVRSAVAMAAAY
jgi:hypothetical protein